MDKATNNHWGAWVIARSAAVGFRSQKELAKAVGCTEDRLSKWVQMPRPPRRMLKGFDAKLAAALNTSREILFVQWQIFSPTPPNIETKPLNAVAAIQIIRALDYLGENGYFPVLTWLRMLPNPEKILEILAQGVASKMTENEPFGTVRLADDSAENPKNE